MCGYNCISILCFLCWMLRILEFLWILVCIRMDWFILVIFLIDSWRIRKRPWPFSKRWWLLWWRLSIIIFCWTVTAFFGSFTNRLERWLMWISLFWCILIFIKVLKFVMFVMIILCWYCLILIDFGLIFMSLVRGFISFLLMEIVFLIVIFLLGMLEG